MEKYFEENRQAKLQNFFKSDKLATDKNTFIEKYAEIIENNAQVKNYAVWNLLDVFGGNKSIKRNSSKGYKSRDKVHYSKAGYEKQGELFFEAFLQSYELFKSTKQ